MITHKNAEYSKIAVLFNKEFNTSVTPKAIQMVLLRRGIIKRQETKKLSEAQRQFIIDNFTKIKAIEFIKLFNKKFGTDFSIHTIRSFANKELGLKKNAGSFRKCVKPYDVITHKDGRDGRFDRHLVAIDNPGGKRKHKYISLEKYLYEKTHEVSTDGKFIIHLDGNIENFDIDNLYLLTNQEMATVKQILGNKLIIERNKEITMTAINLAKLMIKLKGINDANT